MKSLFLSYFADAIQPAQALDPLKAVVALREKSLSNPIGGLIAAVSRDLQLNENTRLVPRKRMGLQLSSYTTSAGLGGRMCPQGVTLYECSVFCLCPRKKERKQKVPSRVYPEAEILRFARSQRSHWVSAPPRNLCCKQESGSLSQRHIVLRIRWPRAGRKTRTGVTLWDSRIPLQPPQETPGGDTAQPHLAVPRQPCYYEWLSSFHSGETNAMSPSIHATL